MASTSAKLYWSKYLRREASDNQPSTRTYQPANSMGLQQLSKTGRAGKPVLANPQIPSLFLVHITIKPSRHYLASSITNFRMNRWHLSHKYLILMAEIVCQTIPDSNGSNCLAANFRMFNVQNLRNHWTFMSYAETLIYVF